MASVQDTIHDQLVSAIGDLGLLYLGEPVPVLKRKVPAAQEALETLPLIAVALASTPGDWEPFDSGGPDGRRVVVDHRYEVAVVAAGNMSRDANLPLYGDWLEAIATRFSPPDCLPVPGLLLTRVAPKINLDRDAQAMLYDYIAVDITFRCVHTL